MEDEMLRQLRQRGYQTGFRRMIIIQELCRLDRIESAEDFWLLLRAQHGISWATVYTNLRLLLNMGLREKEAGMKKSCAYRLVRLEHPSMPGYVRT
jgi:Fe2+ or Zn2+ uptake regulation protein